MVSKIKVTARSSGEGIPINGFVAFYQVHQVLVGSRLRW